MLKPACTLSTVIVVSVSPCIAAAANVLTAESVSMPPTIDGNFDDAWDAATPLSVVVSKLPYQPSNGYDGSQSSEVTLSALHDQQNLYLLVQYQDSTESLERLPWVKQEDGSWEQLSNKDSTGHENTYYEDKFAMLWDINARGFAKKGCDAACHIADDGMINGIPDTSPGRKFTSAPGQTIDMWHWKSVRTGPVDQVDDQYIDGTTDPEANRNWGRKGDNKTGGGYANNVSEAGTQPAFMAEGESTGQYWLLDQNKTEFVDNFEAGEMVPGIVVSPFAGSRGDILASASWSDGVWTIEMQRPLVTSGEMANEQDVQFDDLEQSYPFGIAVFDNSQINHLYHEGALTLEFSN